MFTLQAITQDNNEITIHKTSINLPPHDLRLSFPSSVQLEVDSLSLVIIQVLFLPDSLIQVDDISVEAFRVIWQPAFNLQWISITLGFQIRFLLWRVCWSRGWQAGLYFNDLTEVPSYTL